MTSRWRTLIGEQLLHKRRLPVQQDAQAAQCLHKKPGVLLWQGISFWIRLH